MFVHALIPVSYLSCERQESLDSARSHHIYYCCCVFMWVYICTIFSIILRVVYILKYNIGMNFSKHNTILFISSHVEILIWYGRDLRKIPSTDTHTHLQKSNNSTSFTCCNVTISLACSIFTPHHIIHGSSKQQQQQRWQRQCRFLLTTSDGIDRKNYLTTQIKSDLIKRRI